MRKISAQMLRRIIQTEANKLLREGKVDQADKVFNSASALLKAIQKFEETATQNQISSLSVFPNPVQEYSIFQFEVDQPSEASYSIINMMGQTVFSQKLGYVTSGVHSVNFLGLSSILSSGHYLISVQASGVSQTIPFIKQ